MKYSYNWLKELSGTKLSAEKAAELLTMHSFEIERVDKIKNDSVIEMKVLPDRAHDAMSHVGVARELSVLSSKKLEYDFDNLKLPKMKSKRLNIKINDKNLCSRYIGSVMEDVTVKDSPQWMKARLIASGMNPINNVVDATNYVMLELGQPLHAFDFSKIEKNTIIIRQARKNEKITLLDDTAIKLSDNNLLITNGETPLALAGVKGGKIAEIDQNTTSIILEAANFNPVSVRKTRIRHNLKTEASDRFEKEIDPNLAEKAMTRVIKILERTSGAKLGGVVDVYQKPVKPWKIKLDLKYVNNLLGETVPKDKIVTILELLGVITEKNKKIITCIIPTFRIDLKTQEDLVEEIGRIWGYEKIKPRPMVEAVLPVKINNQLAFEREIKGKLIGLGFNEVYNYSFYSEFDAEKCGLKKEKHFGLENPMNPDQALVRTSLAPNILKNIYANLKHFENLKIFEVGRTYQSNGGKAEEKRKLIMAEVLEKDPVKSGDTFFNLKGTLEDLFESFGINKQSYEVGLRKNFWHPARSTEIKINGENIGIIGEISPLVLAKYKITKRVAAVEIDLGKFLKALPKELVYKPISKFPTVTRDISFLAKNDLRAADITEFVQKAGGNLVLGVKLFDVFPRDNRTSFAYHIEFGADRTLESEEVDAAMKKITARLEKEFKAEIRK